MSDLDGIRERHVIDYDYRCVCGGSPQVEEPCDALRALSALAESEADAERLAAALRAYMDSEAEVPDFVTEMAHEAWLAHREP